MTASNAQSQDLAHEIAKARELRSYLKAAGDTTRLLVLRWLAERGELSVTELAAELRVSQPLISWHLGVLRRVGLVSVRREGRMVRYSLDREAFFSFLERIGAWISESKGDLDSGRLVDAEKY
jgi:DNA-binding transcriptional ArsR family regulator